MKVILTFIALILITLFNCDYLKAQVDQISILKIRKYLKYIDSLSENDTRHKFVFESIREGIMVREVVPFSIDCHNCETDTGGFSINHFYNTKGDTVYKICYYDNIIDNIYEDFYYKDNKLIYSKIKFENGDSYHTYYYREELYENNNVLLVDESPKKDDLILMDREKVDLRKIGNSYLEKFKKWEK